jgi:hypothetical protein
LEMEEVLKSFSWIKKFYPPISVLRQYFDNSREIC